ncbi:MAG: hypothetical protein ACK5ZT_07060 [Sphingobacteriaceae bacterium]
MVLFSQGCVSEKKEDICGNYESKKVSRIKSLFSSYAIGMKLEVRRDSTFKFETCGNLGKGAWGMRNDTLILFMESNKAKKDSSLLNNNVIKYYIKRNGEIQRIIMNGHEKVYDCLIKTKS